MILALIASGLTLIFGIMDVVNFAHGELFMLGAYVGVIIITTTGSFWLALIGASLINRRAYSAFASASSSVSKVPTERPIAVPCGLISSQ